MSTATLGTFRDVSEQEYKRRIRAWTMYDWANSAFATTILAAVLPVYYSQVAGATLPSAATATAYWTTTLSISVFVVALLSPVLGTVSDIIRGKKRFLSIFIGFGVIGTGLLVLVQTGDWLLASILFIVGRIGFGAANVFYDALLPHVAKEEDQDSVSARGYAMGYLGGGLLLAINVPMLIFLPDLWGPRLSFLSVAIWWAIFSIPILRQVPEPPAASAKLEAGENVFTVSFGRLRQLLRDIRQYQHLFRFLIAFLIYNDGIGTIIGVAAIYGAELGFGSVELILAVLLVQFVGIPYSLLFGRLPRSGEKYQPIFLAFVLFNMISLPLFGIGAAYSLADDVTGTAPPPFESTATAVGEGEYPADGSALSYTGDWQMITVAAGERGADEDAAYAVTGAAGDRFEMDFNGQKLELTYRTGPDHGIWAVEMDGQPLLDDGEPVVIDAYNPTVRYDVTETFQADEAGEHIVSLVNSGDRNSDSEGSLLAVAQVEVLPPLRQSNLGVILAILIGVQAVGFVLAFIVGRPLFTGLADAIDTKRSILLALLAYAIIAIWGYILDSVIEFWYLAWLVAVVQGGSQALSRSLYASLSPAAKSGEFFGLFSIMSKFSSVLGPLLFAAAVTVFGSSRPAVLSIIAFFIIGGFLLSRVDVAEGRRVARAEDAALMDATG